jgi:hypothetical protein
MTFFPGTPSLEDARVVTVGENSEVSIDIRLAAVSVTSVSGSVIRSDGSPAAGYEVSLRGTHSVVGSTVQYLGMTPTAAGATVAPDGGFTLPSVPAGTYTLQVNNLYRRKPGEASEIAVVPLRVADTPIRDVRLRTAPPAIARGRLPR